MTSPVSGLRLVDRLHAVQEALAPVHERLRVDVLVVLGEVEPALQRLIHHASVVAAGQAELRLDGCAEQRPAELVDPLALDHDAGRRPLERLHIGDRQPHVLEPQRLQRLEAEHVADDRGRQVGDRSRLEQVEVVGDVGEILPRRVRHRIDAKALGAVFLGRPSAGRSTPRSRSRSRIRRRLPPTPRSDRRPSCGVTRNSAMTSVSLGCIVGLPIAHLLVFEDAGFVAFLAANGHRVHVHTGLLRWCAAGRDRTRHQFIRRHRLSLRCADRGRRSGSAAPSRPTERP